MSINKSGNNSISNTVDSSCHSQALIIKKSGKHYKGGLTTITKKRNKRLKRAIKKHMTERSVILEKTDNNKKIPENKKNPEYIKKHQDIIIPENLADAMSKQAQAERERQARVILGTAETEIAEKFAEASQQYLDNPVALHLRGMNMLFEGLKEKGSMVIVPSSALESMNLGATSGLVSLAKANEKS